MSARVLRYRQTMLRLLHVTEAPGFELLIQFFGDALHLEAVKFELVRNFLRLGWTIKGSGSCASAVVSIPSFSMVSKLSFSAVYLTSGVPVMSD
jgi:hypothetical protein